MCVGIIELLCSVNINYIASYTESRRVDAVEKIQGLVKSVMFEAPGYNAITGKYSGTLYELLFNTLVPSVSETTKDISTC